MSNNSEIGRNNFRVELSVTPVGAHRQLQCANNWEGCFLINGTLRYALISVAFARMSAAIKLLGGVIFPIGPPSITLHGEGPTGTDSADHPWPRQSTDEIRSSMPPEEWE